MQNAPKLVAIAYDLNFRHAAEIFSSASEYVRQQSLNWQLLPLNYGFESKLMELANSGRLSGVIGTFVSDEWIKGLLSQEVAAVNLFNFSRIRSAPSICLDDEAIGQSASKHLLEQGAHSFAFIGQDQAYYNQIRHRSFAESVPEGTFYTVDSSASRRAQAACLSKLTTPTGVLCSNDRIARELCNEVGLIGFEVGRELLIMGIGNEPAESTFAGIGLSSFEIPAGEIGQRAMETMAALIEPQAYGEPATQCTNIIAELIPRASTLASPQARLAERALAEISVSVSDADFDIDSLSRGLGTSRRSLELAIRRHFKQSPYKILCEKRLKKAQGLLLHTNHTIMDIGEACGYPEPHHFSAWFKKRTGRSPKAFRAASEGLKSTG